MGKRYDAVLAALTAAESESNAAGYDANADLAHKFLAMFDAADTEDDPEPEAKPESELETKPEAKS